MTGDATTGSGGVAASGLRVGVVLGDGRARAVLLDDADTVLDRCVRVGDDPARLVAESVRELVGAADRARVGRVVVAPPAPLDPVRLTSLMRPVGALRIGAPATTSVPPYTGWPAALTAAVRGPVAMIAGGHEYDGREFGRLDLPSVRRFAGHCRGTVGAVAVTAIDSPVNPSHELTARAVLTDLLGPGVPVVLGHEVGGAGLLERENTALLDAALAPATHLFVERVAGEVAEVAPAADLYLVGGDGTALAAERAAGHPLHLAGAEHGAAAGGAARRSGRDTLVVVEARRRRSLLSARLAGAPLHTGLPTEVHGVRLSTRSGWRLSVERGSPAELARGLSSAAERLGVRPDMPSTPGVPGTPAGPGAAARPGALGTPGVPDMSGAAHMCGAVGTPGRPGTSDAAAAGASGPDPVGAAGPAGSVWLVVVGERTDEQAIPPGYQVWRCDLGEHTAAFGAATAEASGTVDRLFWFGAGGLAECVESARRAASDAAIRSGADPRRLRVGPVREELMTYVPVPCARLRVTATGPLL